jgi:hypothetical protein
MSDDFVEDGNTLDKLFRADSRTTLRARGPPLIVVH